MKGILVSVIIPIYNAEKYLGKCVESVRAQTYSNLDIILSDDGSTDDSGRICDSFMQMDERIQVIHEKNAGLSAARNRGIQCSKGDILLFLDADDYWDTVLVEKILNKMNNIDCDMVFFNYRFLGAHGKILKNTYCEMKENKIPEYADSIQTLRLIYYGNLQNYAWSYAINRNVAKDIWFPKGRRYEDMATTYKYILNCKKIGFIKEKYYNYNRANINSITKNFQIKDMEDVLKNLAEMERMIDDFGCTQDFYVYKGIILCNVYCLLLDNEHYDKERLKLIMDEFQKVVKLVPLYKYIGTLYFWKILLMRYKQIRFVRVVKHKLLRCTAKAKRGCQ